MKVKVENVSGKVLDFLVAQATNMSWWTYENAVFDTCYGCTDWLLYKSVLSQFRFDEMASRAGHWYVSQKYQPTIDENYSGPIIDRNRIAVIPQLGKGENPVWFAWINIDQVFAGPTRAVAAMRCFVYTRLGAEVEVPDIDWS